MINLRYHIVSITAVFLALGIGLTLGSTFLDRVTVDTLKAQLDDVEAQVEQTNEDNVVLGARVEDLEARDEALSAALPDRILTGHLDEVPVLVLATRGTSEPALEEAIDALGAAGADVAGTWWLTDRWLLDDEEEIADLGRLLDVSTDDVDRLRRNAAIRLAELLAIASEPVPEVDDDVAPDPDDPAEPAAPAPGQEPTDGGAEPTTVDGGATPPIDEPVVPEPTEPELVAALVDAGFVEYEARPDAEAGSVLLPGAGARYLVVSGTTSPEGPQGFATALLDELAAEGPVPVLAAQGPVEIDDSAGPVSEDDRRTTFVGPIRDGDLTRERISTVDDIDTAAGLLALVLAIEDLAVPTIGHYGVAPGADMLLPGPVAEP